MFKRNFYTCLLVIAGVLIAGFLYGRQTPASDYISLVFGGSVGDVSVLDYDVYPSLNSTVYGNNIYNYPVVLLENFPHNITFSSVYTHPQSTITSITILNPLCTESAAPSWVLAYDFSNNNYAVFDGSVRYASFNKSMSGKFIANFSFGAISADLKSSAFPIVSVSGFFTGLMSDFNIRKAESLVVAFIKCIISNRMFKNKERWVLNKEPKCIEIKKG